MMNTCSEDSPTPDNTTAPDPVAALDQDIAAFMDQEGVTGQNDQGFNQLALREFALHFAQVAPFRDYCLEKKATPETVQHWRAIPAVPAAAFKNQVLASFPLEKTVQSNLTSGTTGRRNRGKIYRDQGSLALVTKANSLLTRTFLFPDVERMKIMLMVPSPKMAPGMGMAIGLEMVRQMFGLPGSAFLISPLGLDVHTLLAAIREAEESGEPLALIGATSCFIYFFNACRKEGISFRLPPGSRGCDSGGYFGQFGDWTKEEFFVQAEKILGISPHHWVNVLGTAECSTNYFDNVLANQVAGKKKERCKEIPSWTRVMVVDPESLEEVPHGQPGLLRHYDLTNRAMILGVQTDNVGVAVEGGFEILGRWCKEKGGYVITYSGGHPYGRVFTTLTDYLMNRRLAKLGRYYAQLEKRNRK